MVDPVTIEGSGTFSVSRCLDELIATHRYLCRRAARKFVRSGLERNDLEQVAALGLIKAARRFDPSTRTPFEAYAWIVIVGELMHYVRDHERIVRIPRRLRALEPHFVRARDVLVGRFGREPSDAEVAAAMGIVQSAVAEVRAMRDNAWPAAIDDADAIDRVDRDAPSIEDCILVRSSFAALPTLERRIIVGVYLLGLSQLELGRRLGISAKRVCRLRRSALTSMHRAWAS